MDSLCYVDREGRWSDGDVDSLKYGKRVGRKMWEKGERNLRKIWMRSVEFELVIMKIDVEVIRV